MRSIDIADSGENRSLKVSQTNNKVRGLIAFLFMFTYILYDELLYTAGLDTGFTIWKLFFALCGGALLFFIGNLPGHKKVAFYLQAFLCMLVNTIYISQYVYWAIFSTPYTFTSLSQGAGDALSNFFSVAWNTWVTNWNIAMFFCLQIILVFTLYRMLFYSWERSRQVTITSFFVFVITAAVSFITPIAFASGINEAGYYMRYENVTVPSAKTLGMLPEMLMDIKFNVLGISEEYDYSQVAVPETESTEQTEPEQSTEPVEGETETPAVEEPKTYGQNIMDVNFNMEEEDETLLAMNNYFSSRQATNQNEYTGMFKGKDFILITCEAFSSYVIDEERTPTLYKLMNEGFVFNNFYTPIWNVSTSDGEFVTTTGLIPDESVWSYTEVADNYMPFAFGWQFQKEGYKTYAFHNHTWTYYNRDKSYPNMGYTYYGRDHGLDVEKVWPESDVELMELSIPMWINEEGPVHVYYLTVSGHCDYSYPDNMMAWRNKEWVDSLGLDYTTHVQAYIACQNELEKAMKYLLDELEKAGRLDNTVIAFGADHYPFGLTNEENAELQGESYDGFDTEFQLYKNNFCIWTPSITEPIVVDKYTSNLDMCPTLSNLFGLEYDSRLMMGSDVMADNYNGLVVFMDRSFITDTYKYNALTHEVTPHEEGVTIPQEQVDADIAKVAQMFKMSANVIAEDYYRYLFKPEEGTLGTVPMSTAIE